MGRKYLNNRYSSVNELEIVVPDEFLIGRVVAKNTIDKATGEVGACQFQLKEGGVGLTVCFPSGEGAGPQAPSDYGLMPSRHEKEGGIFRVNIRTGEMSICYVFDDKTVCTPQTK